MGFTLTRLLTPNVVVYYLMNVSATEARTAFVSSDAFSKKNVLDSVTYFLRQYKPEQPLADINCLREQAMSVPCIFRKLCMGYALIMREEGRALEAIVPLQAAVEMSRPAPETVVSFFFFYVLPSPSCYCCFYHIWCMYTYLLFFGINL